MCRTRAKRDRATEVGHEAAVPRRTCIGCRRTGAQSALVRVTVRERRVVVDEAHAGGRGAYLCAKVECLDAALRRGAFTRALRGVAEVDDGLRRRFLMACAARKGGELSGRQEDGS